MPRAVDALRFLVCLALEEDEMLEDAVVVVVAVVAVPPDVYVRHLALPTENPLPGDHRTSSW
jgi:hypothetical protein